MRCSYLDCYLSDRDFDCCLGEPSVADLNHADLDNLGRPRTVGEAEHAEAE